MQTHFPIMKGKGRYGVLPRDFWGLLLVPFIMGVMTVSYVGSLSKIMVLYGLVLSFLYMLYFLYHRSELQPEVLIYFIWILWSLGGLKNVIDLDLYSQQMGTIIQICGLIFMVSGITALRRDISFVMLAIGTGGIMIAVSSVVTGEFQHIAYGISTTRAAGITGNANEFAYCLVFVIIAAFYFLKGAPSVGLKVFLSTIIGAAGFFIILSASRKALLGALTFIFLWWLFCKGKKLSRNYVWGYLILLVLLGGIYYSVGYVMNKTFVGQRLLERVDERSDQTRIQMYMEGLEMIKKNPVFGLGLNNYRTLSSSGLYSHSDYIEVAASTGIIGFILYFSIYIILWLRLNRIKSRTDNADLLYTIGILKAAIVSILLISFGRVNIGSKVTWIFLASAIGFTWAAERALAALRRNRINNLER